MKALKYILYGLVIAAAAGLLAYQALVEKNLDSSDVTKCILIIAAAIMGMLKPRKNRQVVSNKKAAYQKAYSEHIRNAFEDDPKLEAKFYNAIHDYNQNKPAAAISKLDKLRKDCQRSADLRAVTIFSALCYDDMGPTKSPFPSMKLLTPCVPALPSAPTWGLPATERAMKKQPRKLIRMPSA